MFTCPVDVESIDDYWVYVLDVSFFKLHLPDGATKTAEGVLYVQHGISCSDYQIVQGRPLSGEEFSCYFAIEESLAAAGNLRFQFKEYPVQRLPASSRLP